MSKRWAIGSLVRGVDLAARTVTAYASTGVMDRHGTVIVPSAFKKAMKGYMANPVILGSHSHWWDNGEPPVIGRVVGWSIDEKGLLVTIEFAKGGIADLYWARYADKFMRAFSVGFRPTKIEKRQREDKTGEFVVFLEVELYEISAVAVPSNPEALCTKDAPGPATLLEHDDIRCEGFDCAETAELLTRAMSACGMPLAGPTRDRTRDGSDVASRAPDAMDAVQGQPAPVVARSLEARLDTVEAAIADLRKAEARLAAAERRLAEVNRDIDHYLAGRRATPTPAVKKDERTPAMPGVF